MKTYYNIVGTETSRTSTSILKPPVRVIKMGWPFELITKHSDVGKDIRKLVIADKGYKFVECDLSQAEARIAFHLAKDLETLKFIESGGDIHNLTSSAIFDIPYESLSKKSPEREPGKHVGHAGQNGMGKYRLMMILADYNIMKSEKECNLWLFKYHKKFPLISKIFWQSVKDCLENDRTIINPFGRIRQFFGRVTEELYKDAYAHIKQSIVADKIAISFIKLMENEFKNEDFNIVQECHDSILALVKDDIINDCVKLIKKELELPIDFSKCSEPLKRGCLTIPAEFKIGEKWSDMEDLII